MSLRLIASTSRMVANLAPSGLIIGQLAQPGGRHTSQWKAYYKKFALCNLKKINSLSFLSDPGMNWSWIQSCWTLQQAGAKVLEYFSDSAPSYKVWNERPPVRLHRFFFYSMKLKRFGSVAHLINPSSEHCTSVRLTSVKVQTTSYQNKHLLNRLMQN